MRRILLLILLSTFTFAATPKIYSTIGDPVYKSVNAVRILSSYKTFKADHKLFFNYVLEAEAAKQEGFLLDKYRMLPETKGRSKLYLELLRHLGVTNKQIAKIVKETMLRTIALHHINTYRAIKKSRHPVLRQDPELRHAMKQFEARLARERKKQKEEKAVKYASYLRSYGNLKGHWQTTADSNERISFVFSSKTHLRVTQTRNNRSSIFEGAWTSDQKHIIFNIAKTINQSENGTTHSRTTSVRLYYVINSIDRQNITLLDTRRNKKIELHRKRR